MKCKMVKLAPAFKDYLWGGTRLKDMYCKDCEYDVIAESWELSTHKDGQSIVASGGHKGMLFGEYINYYGKEILGWKSKEFDKFPVLIKFIDAKKNLSIQVHPNDEYALKNENEYGKNELWYVIDCEKDAFIYHGMKKKLSKDEFKKKVKENKVLDILNEVKVKKGDVFFIEAGTIHAIGKGVFICEIQQNSNSTYRIYDYNRKDKYGNTRELQLEKAFHVVNCNECVKGGVNIRGKELTKRRILGKCDYFQSVRYCIRENMILHMDASSFYSIIVIDGHGTIQSNNTILKYQAGDSIFIPAYKQDVLIKGACLLIVTYV